MPEHTNAFQLGDAFRQRALVMQKIERLRDVVLGLHHPTLVQLTKLHQDLWEAYHEHSRAHSYIIGYVPDEELPQQESEYDAFDQLFNEVGVPLEEKLIALRSAKTSATDHVAHQQQPWTRSVPTLFRNSSWSTPTMTWESIRPTLSGQTANQAVRSRPKTLEAEVDLRVHSPPTSSPSSTPETRSRFLTLDADTALRSRMPPTNGPCRRSKPAPASGALETEEAMRDLFPPTKPKSLSQFPEGDKSPSTTPTNKHSERITTSSEPVDSTDLPVSVVPSDFSTENRDLPPLQKAIHSEGSVDHDKQSKDMAPQARSKHDASRVIKDNGHEEDIDEEWSIRLDTAPIRTTMRIEPQLPPAAKPPDKECQPDERYSQQNKLGNQTKQRADKTAAEKCRYKVDVSPKNLYQYISDRNPAIEDNCHTRTRIPPATPNVTIFVKPERSSEENVPLPEIESMSTTKPNPKSDQQDSYRGARTNKHELLQAVKPPDVLDQVRVSRRALFAILLRTVQVDEPQGLSRAKPNPQLPAAAKPPDKHSQLNEHEGGPSRNRKMQRIDADAAEDCQSKVNVSSMNPNSDMEPSRREKQPNRQSTHFFVSGGPVRVIPTVDKPHQIHESKQSKRSSDIKRSPDRIVQYEDEGRSTAKRCHKPTAAVPTHKQQPQWISIPPPFCTKLDPILRARVQPRSLCSVPLQRKVCIWSERKSTLKSVRTSEALGCHHHLNGTPRSWMQCRQFTAARSTFSYCRSEFQIPSDFKILICSFLEATEATPAKVNFDTQLCRQLWTPELTPYMANLERIPRSSNQHFNDVSSQTREWPSLKPRDVGKRKPTNESEPAHRKCSVGKRRRTDERCHLPNPMMTLNCTNATPGTCCLEEEPPRNLPPDGATFRSTNRLDRQVIANLNVQRFEPMVQRGGVCSVRN